MIVILKRGQMYELDSRKLENKANRYRLGTLLRTLYFFQKLTIGLTTHA